MNTFWKSLHRLAQDQLFTHGYLAPGTAIKIAAARKTSESDEQAPAKVRHDGNSPWPRLAALR